MLLTQQSLCTWSTRLLRLKVAISCVRLTVAVIPQYRCFDIFSSNPLGSPNHSPYHSRGRLADAINANNFCHRQVSLCFACKIGGTFSSRVSELCLSACRLHDCETHRTRFVNTIRRGLNSPIPLFRHFLLHPSGALPHLPYFLLRKKQWRTYCLHAYTANKTSDKCLKCSRFNKCPEVLPCFDRGAVTK